MNCFIGSFDISSKCYCNFLTIILYDYGTFNPRNIKIEAKFTFDAFDYFLNGIFWGVNDIGCSSCLFLLLCSLVMTCFLLKFRFFLQLPASREYSNYINQTSSWSSSIFRRVLFGVFFSLMIEWNDHIYNVLILFVKLKIIH